jgi:hypothetical protein
MNPKDSRNNKMMGNKFIDKKNWKSYNEELVRVFAADRYV